jgi:glutamate synthase domain-containing protein 2
MRRFATFFVVLGLGLITGTLALVTHSLWLVCLAIGFAILTLWGLHDIVQTRHSLARNYPIFWAARYLFESIRPQIRQYLIESDTDGVPFDRKQRSLVYQRAKNTIDVEPFGTDRNVGATGFEWINHSIYPAPKPDQPLRVQIGGSQCARPYLASVLNISAMSFGALSAQAIRALNLGACRGGFAHDTGEGGLSPYHLEHGGDVIWEIGTGYFGCRTPEGAFDPQRFRDRASHESVRMIEIKLSQGAKPGHGGILPGAKITPEIAAIRGVPMGVDCVSPPRHGAFDSPLGMMRFIAKLRELSLGKPVGFKLCIGHRWEFLALCKAMIETDIYPDFIVIDGKEGGTGAAPVEFADHVGTPRREGLLIAGNALNGCGIRDKVKLGVSGKIISGFDMAVTMAMGADWCNSARGFMFALGCLQSQKCHTNRCPVGVATQDPSRQRGLVVEAKAQRVANYHRHTVNALADLVAAAGLEHPARLTPAHVQRRLSAQDTASLQETYEWLAPGQLIDGGAPSGWLVDWQRASASSFAPTTASDR